MSPFAAEFDAAAEMLDERFGETITYYRGLQSLLLTGVIRGASSIEAQRLTRGPNQAELHTVDWIVRLSDLDDLADVVDGSPDQIVDSESQVYTVIRVAGDQDWDFTSPDQTHVRIRSMPDPAAADES